MEDLPLKEIEAEMVVVEATWDASEVRMMKWCGDRGREMEGEDEITYGSRNTPRHILDSLRTWYSASKRLHIITRSTNKHHTCIYRRKRRIPTSRLCRFPI
jgi:hypothetical protein